jgi:hypothetical protein
VERALRTRRNIFLVAILISLSFLFSGCASDTRREEAEGIARHAGLIRENIQAPPFLIATWSRITPPVTALHVYIEGDGFAWKSRTQPSNDPTPNNPTGLKLAAADANANVLYLARPCQFITPFTRQLPRKRVDERSLCARDREGNERCSQSVCTTLSRRTA